MLSRPGIIADIIHGNIGRSGITISATIGARITGITVDHAGIHTAITDTTAGVIIIGTITAMGITREDGTEFRALRRPFSCGVIDALVAQHDGCAIPIGLFTI